MALTLVIIVRSERMSHSEPRKPLNFPQKKKSRTEQNEGLKKGRRKRKRTDGEKKRSDKRVCQMRKGGEMKKGLCVSRRCSSDFLKSPFLRQLHLRSLSAPAPPRPRKQQTPPESRFSSPATARSFPHGRSF